MNVCIAYLYTLIMARYLKRTFGRLLSAAPYDPFVFDASSDSELDLNASAFALSSTCISNRPNSRYRSHLSS